MKEDKKQGLESAFPFIEQYNGQYGDKYWNTTIGISTRFYAACAAMQGILANTGGTPLLQVDRVIKLSYEMADELLAQENK